MNKSDLWREIETNVLKDIKDINISNFRIPGGINSRLASWDPYDNESYRYFLNIIYNLTSEMPPVFFNIYKNINNTDLGKPVSIKYNGLNINIDYLLSVQEAMFLDELLYSADHICEIGAGFGRTCHTILNNFSDIKSYTIIDLPKCMILSQKYLSHVLDKSDFMKIKFIDYKQANMLGNVDLVINIDSFAEMEKSTVYSYLNLINKSSDYFYTRNPICKYNNKRLGVHNHKTKQSKLALLTGLCTEVIDIFDNESLSVAKKNYLKRYAPGINWTLIKEEVSKPWQYYHHALYAKY